MKKVISFLLVAMFLINQAAMLIAFALWNYGVGGRVSLMHSAMFFALSAISAIIVKYDEEQ